MKVFLAFILLFALVNFSEAGSQVITDGNSLWEGLRLLKKGQDGQKLSEQESHQFFLVVGYIHGFLGGCGMWKVLGSNAPFNLPKEGIQPIQFIHIVDKYLNDHPERLHEMADASLLLALRDSFPNPEYKEPDRPSEK